MKKRFFSIIMVLLLSLVIVACKDTNGDDNGNRDGNGNGDADTIAPLLEVTPESVSLEFNQEYDLMTGVTARDNVDGTITDKVVIDDGGFDNQIPGTYTITYTVKDAAGNEATKTRTITVAEMRTTIEIDGDQFPINFNPQLGEYNELSFPFDLTKVTVLEAAYVDWLVENNDQRFGAYWSVVATLDADLKVVEYRDYNTNQVDAEGSAIATHWSTGTGTGSNNDYVNRWGMLGNLDVPEGGYVVVFINDGVNGEGSPRAFGSKHLVDAAFEAIGKQVILHNVPDEAKFDADKTYPVIRLEEEVLDKRELPVVMLDKGTKITDQFGENLLGGVSVTHDRETLTPVVHEIFKIDEDDEETIITAAEIDENDSTVTYGIRYRVVDALGNVGTETRVIRYNKGEEPAPEGPFITIDGKASFEVTKGYDFAVNIGNHSKVFVFTHEEWQAISDVVDAEGNTDDTYKMANIALAVTDANGKVVAIRLYQGWTPSASGVQLTLDSEGNMVVEVESVFPRDNIQIGVMDLIPDGGFVYVFSGPTPGVDTPEAFSDAMKFGYKYLLGLQPHLLDTTTLDGEKFVDFANAPVNPFAEGFVITVGTEFVEPTPEPTKTYVKIGDEEYLAEQDTYEWNDEDGVGVVTTHALIFSKEYLETLPGYESTDPEDWGGRNYVIQYGILAITDKDGKVLQVRIHPGHKISWDNDDYVVDTTTLTATTLHEGLLADIPDDGFVFLFQNSGAPNNAIRAWGAQQLTGYPDVGGTGYSGENGGVENMNVNPFAEDFVIEIVTE